ncbi:hypothetical protein [Chryseolinea serpens]|nr:hypothetical protein [Chryseolinea serpens]
MSIKVHPSGKTTDILYLPPLRKFIGKELKSLLVEINPDNYDKFYIDVSQGIRAGIIIQFKDSGAALRIYFVNDDNGADQDWEKANNRWISRIEIYRDNEFVTLFTED